MRNAAQSVQVLGARASPDEPATVLLALLDSSGVTLREARVERVEISDPDDVDPSDVRGMRTRKARRIEVWRSLSVVARLHATGGLSSNCVKAAARLLADHELSDGARIATARGDFVDCSGRPDAMQGPLDAAKRLREARGWLGSLGQYVYPVVIHNRSLGELATLCQLRNQTEALGSLRAGLEYLHDRYWPKSERPKPVAEPVGDERVGRWR